MSDFKGKLDTGYKRSSPRQMIQWDDNSLTAGEFCLGKSNQDTQRGRDCHHEKWAQLWIRTSASPFAGFGHLRRSLTLARLLAPCARPIFLLDREDIWSPKLIHAGGWDHVPFNDDGTWPDSAVPSAILIDTRETHGLENFIRESRKHHVPVISIHDLGLCSLPSDVVIDGSIAPLIADFPRTDSVFLAGTDYLVLDPAYALIHSRAKKIKERIELIMVNLGGGNSQRFLAKVLNGLKLWQKEVDVIGFRGFAPMDESDLELEDWHPLHFRWAEKTETPCEIGFRSDVAITAGGLSAYEVLCTGTPLLALSFDALQQLTISKLEESGSCINLGSGEALNPDSLRRILDLFSLDCEVRFRLSKAGRRILDGSGAARVAEIIRCSLSSRPISAVC